MEQFCHSCPYPAPEPALPGWLALTIGVVGSLALMAFWFRVYRSGWQGNDEVMWNVTSVCFAYCWFATSVLFLVIPLSLAVMP